MDSRISARALSAALGGWRTREPAYEALADGVRLLCLDNRLAPRTALPAERELAAALGLSRSTVAAAYRSLRDTGHIASLRGSGSVTLPLRSRDQGRTVSDPDAIDLQQASPSAWPGLAGVITDAAASATSLVSRVGYDVYGNAALREAIAAQYCARGIPTTPGEVMVTTGAQSAIHLIASVLLGRGDRALIESPTYPHAAEALRRAGARLVGVPVTTGSGWDLDRAEQAFARTLPVLAYLMPDFHNPTGRSMSAQERETFLRAGERAGSLLVIDETTADLDIDRGPREPGFLSGDPTLVVRIGSLGKTVWGGLRVGWIRADADLIRRLLAARSAHELGTPEFEQSVAALLLAQHQGIVAQRSELLRLGRDALGDAVAEAMPEWQVPPTHGGVSFWIELDAPLSSALVMSARTRGLLLSAGPRFSVDGGYERHLRLPFTAPVDDLRRAVDILADSWRDARAGTPGHARELYDAVV
ncbi:PLP-dependent aminotransferase family protein [Microbacterium terricola]|uniref:GntR family transcriptional regulator n=1 Tax=Microbacterium terricola TaxID=344163 RepID=A0ABM8DYM4_9MICO|nr:PLP-dependent aminotransferase family protein [Microbacterium terricola]UYK41423.1 PLP-dependent aminotransferase family protein [Microbacterium terricola]BDV30788.1 GntR family transcriptional regulator [Microbacterium terricola]